jgi:hypothetical protein
MEYLTSASDSFLTLIGAYNSTMNDMQRLMVTTVILGLIGAFVITIWRNFIRR